jgi:membrane associated rhomboid family serine protease
MAFLQETRPKHEPVFNAPLSLVLLIAVLAAAHVARVVSPTSVSNWAIDTFAFDPAVYSSSWLFAHGVATPSFFARAIPFVSYMFLHGSWLHLGVNCLWLFAFGAVVARRFGAGLFYFFFAVCGIAGALVFLALEWGQNVGAIGASGAISGIMAAAIRMLRRPGAFGDWEPVPLVPLFSRQVLLFSAVWLAGNMVTGLTGLGAGPGIQAIAWQAHLGGYIAGLFLTGPFDRLHARVSRNRQPAA